jgi:hypothetical protein
MYDAARRETAGKHNIVTDLLDEIDRLNGVVDEMRGNISQTFSGMHEARDVIERMLAFSWGAKQEAQKWLLKWYSERPISRKK